MPVHQLRLLQSEPSNAQHVVHFTGKIKGSMPLKPPPPVRHKVVPVPRGNVNKDVISIGGGSLFQTKSSAELAFDIEELKIRWDDLVLKERIGAGNFTWWLQSCLEYPRLLFDMLWGIGESSTLLFFFVVCPDQLDCFYLQVLLVQFIVLNGMIQYDIHPSDL